MNYNLTGLLLLKNRLNMSQKDERINRFRKYYSVEVNDLCRFGDLNGIKWQDKYNYLFTEWAMNLAAEYGHLEVVKWLHYNRKERCTKDAMNSAAEYGHLEIVKFFEENVFKKTD